MKKHIASKSLPVQDEQVNLRRFTLIELLVVIAIIAILASILMPSLQSARQRGQGAGCLNNLKQLSLASQHYSEDYKNWLPRTSFSFPGSGGSTTGIDLFGRKSMAVDALDGWFVYMSTASSNHSNVSATLPRLKYIPSDTSIAKGVLICPADPDPRFGHKNSKAMFKLSYVINSGVTGGSYNLGDQTNWMTLNDFSRIPNKEAAKGPSRQGPGYYPLFLDGTDCRDADTYKTHFAKAAHTLGELPSVESMKDPMFWIPGKYGQSGLSARHNACVNTVFVDGHAKAIMTPLFNTHSGTTERKLRWLCPGYADGAHWR